MTREVGAGELPGLPVPAPRRRGRPPGSKNRGTEDFHRWLQAIYPGMTPAQQSAMVALVTPKEVRAAKGDVLQAMAEKAKALALTLGVKTAEAWRMMAVERAQLLSFAHPKLSQVDLTSGNQQLLPTIFMPGPPIEEYQRVTEVEIMEVAPLRSHEDGEP